MIIQIITVILMMALGVFVVPVLLALQAENVIAGIALVGYFLILLFLIGVLGYEIREWQEKKDE